MDSRRLDMESGPSKRGGGWGAMGPPVERSRED